MKMAEEDVVSSGLIALYKFEGNGRNSVRGTGLPGSATGVLRYGTSRSGYGRALKSSGRVPTINIHPYDDDYTIAFWCYIKPDTSSGVQIFSSGYTAGDRSLYPFSLVAGNRYTSALDSYISFD